MEDLKLQSPIHRNSVHQSFLSRIPLSALILDSAPITPLPETASISEFLNLTASLNTDVFPIQKENDAETHFMLSKFDAITALSFSTNSKKLQSLTCGEVVSSNSFSSNCICLTYDANKNLNIAIEPFTKGVRAILTKHKGSIYMLTQLNILSFLINAAHSLSAMLDGKIKDLGLLTEEDKLRIEIVTETLTFTQAFKRTFQKEIECVLIVEKNNKQFKDSIGNQDLVKIDDKMYMEICELNVEEVARKLVANKVTCSLENTLFEVMQKMKDNKKSEIAVVDNGSIIGLIGFNELLCKFSLVDYRDTDTTRRLSMMHRNSK